VKDKSTLQTLHSNLFFSERQLKLYDIQLMKIISIKLIYLSLKSSGLPV